MKRPLCAVLTLTGACLAAPAFAHPFHDAATDFAAGFAHAFLGMDHLLAMFAVGMWAMLAGRRAIVLAPLVFCAAVALGAVLGLAGLTVPAVEPLVAASVLALGLLIVAQRGGASPPAIALIATFGLLHGLAHGAGETPLGGVPAVLAGLLLASVTLHATGAATAFAFDRRVRACGVALMTAGVWLLAHA